MRSDFSDWATWTARSLQTCSGGHQMRMWTRPGCRRGAPLSAMGAEAVATPAEAFDAVVVFTMLAKAAVVGPPRPSLCRQS